MIPILNALPAASTGGTGHLATGESGSPTPADTPLAGSFTEVLAGQEAVPIATDAPAEGTLALPGSGNLWHTAGKGLPGMIAAETGIPVADSAVVELPPGATGETMVPTTDLPQAVAAAEAIPAAAVETATAAELAEVTDIESVAIVPGVATAGPEAVAGEGDALPGAGTAGLAQPSLAQPEGRQLAGNQLPEASLPSAAVTADSASNAPPSVPGPAPQQPATAGVPTGAAAGVAESIASAESVLQAGAPVSPPLNVGQKPIADGATAQGRPLSAPPGITGVAAPVSAPIDPQAAAASVPIAEANAQWRQAALSASEPAMAGSGAESMAGVDAAEPGPARLQSNAPQTVATGSPAGPAVSLADGGQLSGQLTAAKAEPMTYTPGQANWNDEFVGRVSLLVKNGASEARLQLNPAELGQLDIKISTDGDRAVIMFSVQNSATREAIDLAMPRLREMLEQSGLQLAHSEVSDHSQSRQQNDGTTPRLSGDTQAGRQGEADLEDAVYRLPPAGSNSVVDYYA